MVLDHIQPVKVAPDWAHIGRPHLHMLTYYFIGYELPQEVYTLEPWSVLQSRQTLTEFKAGGSFLKDRVTSTVLRGNLESTFSH